MTRDEAIVSTPLDTDEFSAVAKLLSVRFSCRGFRPAPVPHALIQRLLTIAQLTPSWCNSQAWQVAVTEGAGTERFRRALFAHASANAGAAPQYDFSGPQYAGVYQERRREVGWQLYESVGVSGEIESAPAARRSRIFGCSGRRMSPSSPPTGTWGSTGPSTAEHTSRASCCSRRVSASHRFLKRRWHTTLRSCANISISPTTAVSSAQYRSATKIPIIRPTNSGRAGPISTTS